MKKPVKDVFGLWQIKGVLLSAEHQFPYIEGTSKLPKGLVPFTKRKKELHPEDKALHFYENDEKFINLFASQKKTTKELETFRKYRCVITPDFSVYRDLPLVMQMFQVYKSRAVGTFLQRNGIKIIPNIRWGDERTYDFAFEGLFQWGVVAVGVRGAYSNKDNAHYFEKGFLKMLEVIDPETVLCYGRLSTGLKNDCQLKKINIIEFPCDNGGKTKQKTVNNALL